MYANIYRVRVLACSSLDVRLLSDLRKTHSHSLTHTNGHRHTIFEIVPVGILRCWRKYFPLYACVKNTHTHTHAYLKFAAFVCSSRCSLVCVYLCLNYLCAAFALVIRLFCWSFWCALSPSSCNCYRICAN